MDHPKLPKFLSELSSQLAKSDTVKVLDDLVGDSSCRLEVALAACQQDIHDHLVVALVANYDSLGSRALRHIAAVLQAAPPHLLTQAINQATARILLYLPSVIEVLGQVSRGDIDLTPVESAKSPIDQHVSPLKANGHSLSDEFAGLAVKTKQKERKKAVKAAKAAVLQAKTEEPPIDVNLFNHAKVDVPTSKQDAQVILESLRNQHVQWLKDFAGSALRSRDMIIHLCKSFWQTAIVATKVVAPSAPVFSEEATPYAFKSDLFPSIQPLKAAQYFAQDVSDVGAWRIFLSGAAISDLRNFRDAKALQIATKKILELSNGFFSDDNQKALDSKYEEGVPLFEAKGSGDMRVIWQVDLSEENGFVHQIIRVQGIVTHAQLDRRITNAIAYESLIHDKEYVKRCRFRKTPKTKGTNVSNVVEPTAWPKHDGFVLDTKTPTAAECATLELTEADLLGIHESRALQKYIPWSTNVLKSLTTDDAEIAHVFECSCVRPQEDRIINQPGSVFVIGRSGTGKTTCMLFRIMGLECGWRMDADRLPIGVVPQRKRRQIFVTQSAVLTQRVREYYEKLSRTYELSQRTDEELATAAALRNQTRNAEELIDVEDEEDDLRAAGLPDRWSDLNDGHFPLFLSYNQLLSLLEADFGISHGRKLTREQRRAMRRRKAVANNTLGLELPDEPLPLANGQNNGDATSSDDAATTTSRDDPEALESRRRDHFVNFDVFKTYWSGFDARKVKGLDPALVFSEIIGVIRGSEPSHDTDKGYISQDTYLNLSTRTNDLLARRRTDIYDIFKAYLARKRESGDYDAADRTHGLIKAIEAKQAAARGGQGDPFVQCDMVCVDEAQDQLLIDCKLLRLLCATSEGLFFAGDTAQTINHVSFRFDDLKAAFYRLEEADPLVVAGIRKASHPWYDQLHINYRSHGGITAAANFVVDAILQFWPNSIDKLKDEEGRVLGPKPVFLNNVSTEKMDLETSFVFGDIAGRIEFGAEQCILVRNDEARDELRKHLGEQGALILTIAESKGLEFADVLLYQPWADSRASASDWRVLLNLLPENQRSDAPQFDEIRHAILCQELKTLYVAITRTRSQLIIYDTSPAGDLMRQLLKARGLITVSTEMPTTGTQSSPAQWIEVGQRLFQRALHQQAAQAFKKGERPDFEAAALAYQARKEAATASRRLIRSNEVDNAFRKAAAKFEEAGRLAEPSAKKRLYTYAGEMYDEAHRDANAANAYLAAGDFELAARRFRRAGLFDSVVRVLREHRADIKASAYESLLGVAKIEYLRKSNHSQALDLFNNVDELLEFVQENGLAGTVVSFLEGLGRWAQAAEIRRNEGNLGSASKLYARAAKEGDQAAAISHLDCLLERLWRQLPMGWFEHDDSGRAITNATLIVSEATEALTLCTGPHTRTQALEVEIFDALLKRQYERCLEVLQALPIDRFDSLKIMALDLLLRNLPTLTRSSLEDIHEAIAAVQGFADMTKRVIVRTRSGIPRDLRRLLGVIDVAPDETSPNARELRLLTMSPFAKYTTTLPAVATDERAGRIVSAASLASASRSYLARRLYDALRRHHARLLDAQALLSPCLSFLFDPFCPRNTECRQEHVRYDDWTLTSYSEKIRVVAEQLNLNRNFGWLAGLGLRDLNSKESTTLQSYWIDRYSELAYPAAPIYHVSELGPDSITGWERFVDAVTVANADRLWRLDPKSPEDQLLAPFMGSSWTDFDLSRTHYASYSDRLPVVHNTTQPRLQLGGRPLLLSLTRPLNELQTQRHVRQAAFGDLAAFLEAVTRSRLRNEINFAIHHLENAVALCIVGLRAPRDKDLNGFSGLQLPAGILKSLVERHGGQHLQVLPLHMDMLIRLLEEHAHIVWTGASHLTFRGTYGLRDVRHFFLYRILRLLALIAVNLAAPHPFAPLVLQTFKRLSIVLTEKHTLYNKYLTATHIAFLARYLSESSEYFAGTPEQLVEVKKQTQGQPKKGYRTVRAATIAELAAQLAPGVERQVFDTGEDEAGALSPGPDSESETSSVAPSTSAPTTDYSEEQRAAAQTLLRVLRKVHDQRVAAPARISFDVGSSLAFERALERSPNVAGLGRGGRSARERKLLLGPGSLVVAALQEMQALMGMAKRALTMSLQKIKHADLEDVQANNRHLNNVKKGIPTVLRAFERNPPPTEDELKALVCRSVAFFDEFHSTGELRDVATGRRLSGWLRSAHRAVVDVPLEKAAPRPVAPTAKKARRPALISDDNAYDDYADEAVERE